MSDHPIIFSATMIRALLDGRKSMTRRLAWTERHGGTKASQWTFVEPNDRLWVRESITRSGGLIQYVADGHTTHRPWGGIWLQDPRPSIHMPREISRLTLIVTATKVERLDQISEDDAKAEGAIFHDGHGVGHSGWRHDRSHGYVHKNARTSFACLWDRLHGEGSFNACQEVVALTFTVHKCNIDSIPKAVAEKPELSTPQQDQRGSPK